MNLLLDTCTFLWMIGAPRNLSPLARDLLEDSGNTVFFHQASAWEVQIKFQKGKLKLSGKPQFIVSEGLRLHQIAYAKLNDEAIWHLSKLPDHHKNPFDRILIATALCEGMKMVTPDPKIHAYPVPVIW